MGKISKYSNLYNRDGELIKPVDSSGILRNYTLQETADLVDKLGIEKDSNGKLKYPDLFNNASAVLTRMYTDDKYSDERNKLIKELRGRLKVNKDEVTKALQESDEELSNKTYNTDSNEEEYVDYEEVKDEKAA